MSNNKSSNSDMISHLFGNKTRKLACALSPSRQKGQNLDWEVWDKG